ncbi:MAG TPA: NUDIX domain-containing protein [Candidatus Gracilibacteria bacterium]|nr:NUDIX domain-containing protein [Candidatus Gracilibacteria bacterium]
MMDKIIRVSGFIIDENNLIYLQRRGKFNYEKSPLNQIYELESYPGLLQATVAGSVEEGESPIEALWRELREELSLYPHQLEIQAEEYLGGMYCVRLSLVNAFIHELRLHPGSGGIETFFHPDQIVVKPQRGKYVSFYDLNAMFEDELEVLKRFWKK